MIINSLQELPDGAAWDIIILGSGVIGHALCREFAKTGQRVLVIEAGGHEVTDTAQKWYQVGSRRKPFSGGVEGRFRVYGGSSERWKGQAMRFESCDFEPRPWMLPKGWPVGADELSPWYQRAEAFMKVDDGGGDHCADNPVLRELFGDHPWSEDSALRFHYSKFTNQPRLRLDQEAEIAKSATTTLLLNTRALQLHQDPESGRVTSVTVCSGDGAEREQRQLAGAQIVLAMGGIENCRFLLVQRDCHGLTFDGQGLGQAFQDHPGLYLGEVQGKGAPLLFDLSRYRAKGDISYKARLSTRPEHRMENWLLGVSGTVLLSRKPHASHPHFQSGLRRRLGKIPRFSDLRSSLGSLAAGRFFSPLHYMNLAVSVEDARTTTNCIRLSSCDRDQDGVPRAEIDWGVDPSVVEAVQDYIVQVRRYFDQQGIGKLQLYPGVDDSQIIAERMTDNAHHIGSVPMAAAASDGVVDPLGRVFGIPNLRALGTGMLPTGGFANPTLTAIALALRAFSAADAQAAGSVTEVQVEPAPVRR